MRYLILSIFALSFACAEESVKQPFEVLKAQETYEKGVSQAHAVYAKAEQKVRDDVLKTLEKVKIDYTKKGDLDGAMLVDAYIKKLKAGDALTAVEAKLNEKTDLFGGVIAAAPVGIVGKWDAKDGGWNSIVIIDNKLNATTNNGATKGKAVMNRDGTAFTITWDNGAAFENFTMDNKTNSFIGKKGNGIVTMTRLPDSK